MNMVYFRYFISIGPEKLRLKILSLVSWKNKFKVTISGLLRKVTVQPNT